METKELKILAIGNSFSQDAARYLQPMAQSAGVSLKIVNLYIGGCSLERHWNNMRSDEAAYDHETNGGAADYKCSIRQALQEDAWDIVTMQQASHDSGLCATYEPYLRELSAYVRQFAPQAVQWVHETWAYECDAAHPAFVHYQNDQAEMYRALRSCYGEAAAEIGAKLIPTGDVIQTLRERAPFIYREGGISLCRDGFHLSLNYGRYAAAATWLCTLTGCLPGEDFRPTDGDPTDGEALAVIRAAVREICGAAQ